MLDRVTATKGDFAAMIGVSAGRVSQYIAEGKIHGAALVGQGRLARIDVTEAKTQLAKTLDPSQRFGANGASVRAAVEAPALREAAEDAPASSPAAQKTETFVDEVAAERLKQQRMTTARMEREEALSVGRYTLTDAARAAQVKAVGEAFKVMDIAIQDMGKLLAAQFGLPQRDVLHALQKSFRETRERQAKAFAETAAGLSRHQEDDTP